MKPGDLVRLTEAHRNQFESSEAFETVGLIVCATALHDTAHFKVMWNGGVILVEDARDLEVISEAR
jgi:hypothetical protein